MASSTERVSRVKSDIDIIEHVLEGIQTVVASSRTRVTELAARPWIGGVVWSAVQVQVFEGDSAPDEIGR